MKLYLKRHSFTGKATLGTLYIDGKEHNINYTDIKRFLEKSCFCGIFSHFIEGNDRRKPKEVLRVLNVSSP